MKLTVPSLEYPAEFLFKFLSMDIITAPDTLKALMIWSLIIARSIALGTLFLNPLKGEDMAYTFCMSDGHRAFDANLSGFWRSLYVIDPI